MLLTVRFTGTLVFPAVLRMEIEPGTGLAGKGSAVMINTIVAQTLLSGTYTGTISITPTSGSNMVPAVVQVTLSATAAAVVTFTPAALAYN
jgi:hypothetical protein